MFARNQKSLVGAGLEGFPYTFCDNCRYSPTLFSLSTLNCPLTVLAFFLYYRSIKKVSVTSIAVMSYVDTIVAIVTDVLFFDRNLTFVQTLGILITFVSAYWLVRQLEPVKRNKILFNS